MGAGIPFSNFTFLLLDIWIRNLPMKLRSENKKTFDCIMEKCEMFRTGLDIQ